MPILIAILLLIATTIHAQEPILPSLQALGMAKTAGSGYSALYGNPARILSNNSHLTVSQARLYYDTYSYDIGYCFTSINDQKQTSFSLSAGFSQEIKKNVAVLQILYNYDGTPKINTITGEIETEPVGFADSVDSLFHIGGSLPLSFLIFGCSLDLKHIQHSSNNNLKLTGNIGFIFNFIKEFQFDVTLKHFDISYFGDGVETIQNMVPGTGVKIIIFDSLSIYGSAETDYEFTQLYYGAGIEYKLFKDIQLRSGFNDNRLSAGIGITFENFKFDYAFITNTDFYDANRISVSYMFK